MLRSFVTFLFAGTCLAADPGVMLSQRAPADFELTADPAQPMWKNAPSVVTGHDRYGKPVPNSRTEIRSRWTERNLYFLFSAQYETLYVKAHPSTTEETWGLWDFDVAEVFIGHDFSNINLYKEFEVSPQAEWVDLDVDHAKKEQSVDWKWNSGFRFRTRIDKERKMWFCEMQIPWKSIEARPVRAGNELRLNLYRIEGGPPSRKYLAWRPVNNDSFHTPEAFGKLRLVDSRR